MARRKYDRNAHRRRFKQGKLTYRGKGAERGSGHRAGEAWGAQKQIDPKSRVTKYSKNSPSFDEGVWVYKEAMKGNDRNYWWQFDIGDRGMGRLQGFLRVLLNHYRGTQELSDEQHDQMKEALRIEAENQGISYNHVADWLSKHLRNLGPTPGGDDDAEQFSDAAWWAQQFDVAQKKIGELRFLPAKKESYLRAELSRDKPYTEDEKSKARGEHTLGKRGDGGEPQGKKKKERPGDSKAQSAQQGQKKKPEPDARRQSERASREASANMEINPKTGLTEVRHWTPKKGRQNPATGPRHMKFAEDRAAETVAMPESADAYQGRLIAQFPSVYQPIQFGEKPPNLGRAEHIGRSCAACKHFKPKGGKEVDDQGRCALYDYVVKARMTCDAWTPTKEQQDFRGPGIMLDRKGGDPQHGGPSQMSLEGERAFGQVPEDFEQGYVSREFTPDRAVHADRMKSLQRAWKRALAAGDHEEVEAIEQEIHRHRRAAPRNYPGIPQMSEEAVYFDGYEQHLLETMPERYK